MRFVIDIGAVSMVSFLGSITMGACAYQRGQEVQHTKSRSSPHATRFSGGASASHAPRQGDVRSTSNGAELISAYQVISSIAPLPAHNQYRTDSEIQGKFKAGLQSQFPGMSDPIEEETVVEGELSNQVSLGNTGRFTLTLICIH